MNGGWSTMDRSRGTKGIHEHILLFSPSLRRSNMGERIHSHRLLVLAQRWFLHIILW